MNSPYLALSTLARAIALLPEDAVAARNDWRKVFRGLIASTNEPKSALAAAYVSRDAQLFSEVFQAFPDCDWSKSIHSAHEIKIGTLITERNYEMILSLRDAGISMRHTTHLFFEVAKKHDDPMPVHFVRRELGVLDPVWKQNNFDSAVFKCGPGLARLMWEELQGHLSSPRGRAMSSFNLRALGQYVLPLKTFAVLLSSGQDLTPLCKPDFETSAPPRLAAFIQKTSSNHGRIALKALEPDPISIIGRDPDETFYGMTPADFLRCYAIDQQEDPLL